MVNISSQNLQVKLSLDEGLKNTWNILTREYQALDKSGIIRLALNNLAKEVKKLSPSEEKELFLYFDTLSKSKEGMSEEKFANWWNKNKSSP
jgi:hypothetical protein